MQQTTDPPDDVAGGGNSNIEGAEEESSTHDEIVEHGSPSGMNALLDHMRADQNIALGAERFNEANQIQQAIITLLDASAGDNPEGLSESVMQRIRGVFQRLYRYHRNRGLDERADRFLVYIQDMQSLLQ